MIGWSPPPSRVPSSELACPLDECECVSLLESISLTPKATFKGCDEALLRAAAAAILAAVPGSSPIDISSVDPVPMQALALTPPEPEPQQPGMRRAAWSCGSCLDLASMGLVEAIRSNGVDAFVLPLIDPMACTTADDTGNLPLHLATACGSSKKIIAGLVEAHPDALQVQNRQGNTPLHLAAANPETPLAVISQLVKAHPPALRVANKSGLLPLHIAAATDVAPPIFAQLLEAWPDATGVADHGGRLPLHVAARQGRSEAVCAKLIEASPAALRKATLSGDLPLHLATRHAASQGVISMLVAALPEALKVANSAGKLPKDCLEDG